jgi:very-short-patch-repair endonuclease
MGEGKPTHGVGAVGKAAATTNRARELRRNLTPQETRLWIQLRALRADGFHFRRQAPLLGFYLDFVCFKHRLVIEVDGSQHGEDVQADHDAMRSAILSRAGFRVLRFWNSDVSENLDGVMVTIQQALGMPPSPSWGGIVDAKHRRGGEIRRFADRRSSPDTPTGSPLRADHPPHEGEGSFQTAHEGVESLRRRLRSVRDIPTGSSLRADHPPHEGEGSLQPPTSPQGGGESLRKRLRGQAP